MLEIPFMVAKVFLIEIVIKNVGANALFVFMLKGFQLTIIERGF